MSVLRAVKRARIAPLINAWETAAAHDAIERDALRSVRVRTRRNHETRLSGNDREMLCSWPEFRSVLYHRLHHGSPRDRRAAAALRRLHPGQSHLDIQCPEVGAGLVINHGFCSTLAAWSIGEDCFFAQLVTMGNTHHGGPPRIGNRVQVHAGATIVGPVTVGDDAIIGAGAVVTKDVPAGEVVVPARNRLLTSGEDASFLSMTDPRIADSMYRAGIITAEQAARLREELNGLSEEAEWPQYATRPDGAGSPPAEGSHDSERGQVP